MSLRKFKQAARCSVSALSATIVSLSIFISLSANADNLVIYGASGNFGSDIVTEALSRGHHVTGVSRSPENLNVDHPNFTAVRGDVTDLNSVLEIITGADAVIMSLRGNGADNSPEQTATYKGAATYIQAAEILGAETPRVLQVGNQATLSQNDVLSFDAAMAQNRYPEGSALHGRVLAHLLIIDLYEAASVDLDSGLDAGLDWVLFAPSGSIGPGERRGNYRVGDRILDSAPTGISQADYAIAFIDEVENPQYRREVISIGY